MSYARTVLLAGLVVMFAAAQADARPSRRKHKTTKPKTTTRSDALYMGHAGDGEKPVEWMTNFDEAVKLAKSKKHAIMVLFTSEEMMQKSTSCRFAANSVRRAVRKANVVPVRLVPPARMSREGLGKEEIAKREEYFLKATKRYRELVRKYRISQGPALVFTAPDEIRVNGLVAPKRQAIETALERLGEMIKAHQKAMASKDAARKPADPPKAAAAGEVAVKPAPKPARAEVPPRPAEEREGRGDDDF